MKEHRLGEITLYPTVVGTLWIGSSSLSLGERELHIISNSLVRVFLYHQYYDQRVAETHTERERKKNSCEILVVVVEHSPGH